ncbi:MAG: hypothetical protein DMF86_00055 [Acidobacteria bacterium]|nr:MAG: hypothetical protein DMF86_00055 [Acidobacteriota bacterium]
MDTFFSSAGRHSCASVLLVCSLAGPPVARAAVVTVPAGGNLQAALDAAQPGDEIRLAPGATFTGNFTLPVKAGDTMITVRSDLPDATLPGDADRVTPATAASFARIMSPNNAAALHTVAGAHHWRLMFLEFPGTTLGYGDIIQLGDGSSAQTLPAQVPHDIVLDHVYVHGSPLYGQKRCIAMNGAAVTIRNSHVSDCKAVGFDAQAIGGWNGPGPLLVENNYLEAAGENFLLGGSDPPIPNLVTADVVVRYNYMARPMSWRDPIIPPPAVVTAIAASSPGTLPAGTYGYRVIARRPVGMGTTGQSTAAAEVPATVGAGSAVTVSWTPVPDATEYRVYGRTPGGENQYWSVTGTSFVDTGAAGTPAAVPTGQGTVWQVKNLFELKNARRVRVEYNVFENNWKEAQPGFAIVLTPRNQDGACTWCVVEDVDFTHNILRNTASGFNISGYDSPHVSQQTNGLRIRDNLVYGVRQSLGGAGWAVLIGEQPRDVSFDHNTFDFDGTTLLYAYGGTATSPAAIAGFQYTNNASPHNTYGINGASASTGTLTFQMYFPAAVIAGNWLSGGSSSRYPSGNRFDAPFDASIVNRAAGDYRLVTTTTLLRAATDGGQVGADVAKLQPLIPVLISGQLPPSLVPRAPGNVRVIR